MTVHCHTNCFHRKNTSIKRILRKLWEKIGQAEVIKFKEGLVIDTEFTALPAVLEVLSFDEAKNTSRIRVTIHEGKFHQVKRMFEAVGSEVLYLKRLSMGTLVLDESLAPGAYRRLTEQEIQMLKETRNIRKMVKDFLPISKKDMKKRGWEQCDFVYVIGDAYVDHSSFGPAIISRLLEAFGYKVGIIAQPDWKDKEVSLYSETKACFYLYQQGNMDSIGKPLQRFKKTQEAKTHTLRAV